MIRPNKPTRLDDGSFELLSLQVAEMEALLDMLTEYGELDNRSGCMVSALQRLAGWLQSDVQAYQVLYREQQDSQGGAA